MIILRYPAATDETKEWVETLKDLSLAHKLEIDEQLESPRLSHSGTDYDGAKPIGDYLDKLYAEREQWWYCTCDRPRGETDA